MVRASRPSAEAKMEEGRGGRTPPSGGGGRPAADDESSSGSEAENSVARRALRSQVGTIGGDEVARVAVLSFRALQLYRIGVLQKELVEMQHALLRDGREPSGDIDGTIQKYADAVRNYRTLTQDIVSAGDGADYQFLGDATDFKVVDRSRREPEIWGQLWRDAADRTVEPAYRLRRIGPLGFRELDRRRRVEQERAAAFGLRLQMACFGVVALLVPLFIMTLRPGLVVDLVTTSVSTVLFGAAAVVLATDSSGRDMLGLTSAYAAVLVIFIGASLTPTSSSST